MDTNERLNKMAIWARGIEAQLAEVREALAAGPAAEADQIAAELGELIAARRAATGDRHSGLVEDRGLALDIKALEDDIATAEAEVYLEVSLEVGDDGKPRYSSDSKRNAAVRVRLAKSEEYQALVAKKRELEHQRVLVRAMLETMDAEASEARRAIDALVARLNNLTARMR